jgi:putative DNA primase/helicase
MSETATRNDARPVALIVEPAGIPAALKVGRRFVVWQYDRREGAWTKLPYNPRTGTRSSSTDSITWGAFDEALTAYAAGGWDGIGVMLRPHQAHPDDLIGVDLDHVYDPERQAITDDAAVDIVITLPSYTEISPSGTGIRIIARGALPASARRGNVEIYTWGRFLTLTGHHLAGTPDTVERIPAALEDVWQRYLAPPPTANGATNGGAHASATLTDDEVITKATAASNGAKVRALLDGDVSAYGGDDSAADLALMSVFAFWTQDHAQLDRLMRGSGLYREKWDSRRGDSTYGSETITKALHNLGETWQGSPPISDTLPPIPGTPDGAELALLKAATYRGTDILSIPKPDSLVAGLLDLETIVGLYGPSGAGKSYFAVDLALTVGSGGSWQGTDIEAQNVLYVAAEGAFGIGDRVHAWLVHHQNVVKHPNIDHLFWQTIPANLFDAKWRTALIQHAAEVGAKLVVIDTLAASMAGGDESATKDMSIVMDAARWLVRAAGCCVVIVHHTGYDESHARGSTAFKAACDTEIQVKKSDGIVTVTVTKQRHHEDGQKWHLHLQLVEGTGQCVLVGADDQTEGASASAMTLLSVLPVIDPKNEGATLAAWRATADCGGERTFYRLKGQLVKADLISSFGKGNSARWTLTADGLAKVAEL